MNKQINSFLKNSLFFTITTFIIISIFVSNGIAMKFDNLVYKNISNFIAINNTKFMILVSNFGGAVAIVTICLFLLVFNKVRIKFGIPVVMTMITSQLLNMILKNIFRRERPSILRLVPISEYSFPSGHAMNNASLYTILVLLFILYYKNITKTVKVLILITAYTFVLLVGFSRIYLGVHYFSDVLAGFSIGYAIAVIVFLIWEKYFTNKYGLVQI